MTQIAATRTAVAAVLLLACRAAVVPASSLSPNDTVVWTGPFGQGFDDVQGIAVDPTGQLVYVADTYYVYEYDSTGVFVRVWGGPGSGPGQIDHASGITVDPFGDVYVADSGNGRVQHFDENGKFLAAWDIPGAREVAADTGGTIYVLANVLLSPYPFVTARAADGTELRTWPAQFPDDFGPSEYYLPHYLNTGTALATDAAGNVIVVGRSFQRFQQPDDDTCARQVWDYQRQYDPRPLADPLASGEIVVFSPQGVVRANGWLSRYSFSCVYVSISDGDARGVAVDPTDGSFFASMAEHFVRQVPDTPPYLGIGAELDIPCLICRDPQMNNFGTPHDLAFDCAGNLYVTSADRILKYRNAGAPPPPCGTKRKHFELALSPALRRPPGVNDKLLVTLGCTGDACTGIVKATGRKPGCKRCRLLLARRRFTVPGDGPQTLELTIRPAALAVLGQGLAPIRLAARARPKHGPARSALVRQATLLDAGVIALACPAGATAGTPAAASGTLAPPLAAAVEVQVEAPDGTTTTLAAAAGADGRFQTPLLPDRAGTWTVRAAWAGDAAHAPASGACAFTANETPPAVTVACPAGGTVGSPLAATATVTPPLGDGQGGIEFAPPSGGLIVIPGGDGTGMLAASLVPAEGGTWMLRGRWASVGGEVTASSACAVDVQRLASSLTLTCPAGMPLTFTGTLIPARAGATVTISYTPAVGGAPVDRTATTAADGSFSDTLPAGTINSGSAQASWPGDAAYAPAASAACAF
ncbi:MAG TPA: NHL repeat-containing protein [Candidatus Binatia bacterium]|nr:NHL repeat-containing protein [Candidatus Binatia bacterium]